MYNHNSPITESARYHQFDFLVYYSGYRVQHKDGSYVFCHPAEFGPLKTTDSSQARVMNYHDAQHYADHYHDVSRLIRVRD